ncbi:hypothetical protein Tco_0977394 [Tanacetum coccineum]|uniref:Uncharacterized protein n=1 Tax=Tanacetum coccineum TaxID=301880 RepID=A0ABQ5EL33_9ASTR
MSTDLGVFHLRIFTSRSAQTIVERGTRSPEYVPEDHVPVYIPEPEHPKNLVPAEDEAPIPPLPPSFLAPRIRPPHTRATMRQMRAIAPSTYHSLLPSGTPPLLPILYCTIYLAAELIIPDGLDTLIRLGRDCYLLLLDLAVRAEIEVLRRERLVTSKRVWRGPSGPWLRLADDLAVQHILRTRPWSCSTVDTLEDTW